MTQDIKTAFIRSRGTILSDALGVLALIVMLFSGLAIPSLF